MGTFERGSSRLLPKRGWTVERAPSAYLADVLHFRPTLGLICHMDLSIGDHESLGKEAGERGLGARTCTMNDRIWYSYSYTYCSKTSKPGVSCSFRFPYPCAKNVDTIH
jgi:hypothetical protein